MLSQRSHQSAGILFAFLLALLPWTHDAWGKPHGPRHHEPQETQYTLRDIGPDFMRGGFVEVTDLEKDQDIVIGIFDDGGYPHAIQLWPAFADLGPRFSRAVSVDGSTIVGYIADVSRITPVLRATIWENGVARSLDPLPGSELPNTIATCINDAGDIWGAANRNPGFGPDSTPVLWPSGGLPILLPTLDGLKGLVNACNAAGDSAGVSRTADGHRHCVVWPTGSGIQECHPPEGADESRAVDLNEAGELIGQASGAGEAFGYLWHFPGAERLQPLPNDTHTEVNALNDLGDAVGRSCTGELPPFPGDRSGTCHAVLWQDGEVIDLLARTTNAQGWTFTRAFGIGNEGKIVVVGRVSDDDFTGGRFALLTPVPDHHKKPTRDDRAARR
jgi:uncharacterized membrane protein